MKLAQVKVTRGGWYNEQPWFTKADLAAIERRWIDRSYAARIDEDRQCGGCRWFAATGLDFGICANPASVLDGAVTFEHGGCDRHSSTEADR